MALIFHTKVGQIFADFLAYLKTLLLEKKLWETFNFFFLLALTKRG